MHLNSSQMKTRAISMKKMLEKMDSGKSANARPVYELYELLGFKHNG